MNPQPALFISLFVAPIVAGAIGGAFGNALKGEKILPCAIDGAMTGTAGAVTFWFILKVFGVPV